MTNTPRSYLPTESFAQAYATRNRKAYLSLGIGVAWALGWSLVFSTQDLPVLSWACLALTVVLGVVGAVLIFWTREHARRIRDIIDAGPYLTISDDGLTLLGEVVRWADIEEIHIADLRTAMPGPSDGAAVHIELADSAYLLDLEDELPRAQHDALLGDLQRTAEEQGTPVTFSRTKAEERAWVDADPFDA